MTLEETLAYQADYNKNSELLSKTKEREGGGYTNLIPSSV